MKNSRPRFSAIDIGSNALRMIIGEIRASRLEILHKVRAPVRLGHDVFKTGVISAPTLEKAKGVFQQFGLLNQKYQVLASRAVATSALREAQNGSEFIQLMKSKNLPTLEIIDGIEEARLIHLAVQREVDLSKKSILLIDVGGGSVELTFSENGLVSATQSFPMGTVRILSELTRRNFTESQTRIILGEFVKPLTQYLESHQLARPLEWAVGTGGNLDYMGKLKKILLKKSPPTLVSLKELEEITAILESMTIKNRVEKLQMRPDRADVIVPAILLVKTILRQAGVAKILIPQVGLRNGLLWSVAEKWTTKEA